MRPLSHLLAALLLMLGLGWGAGRAAAQATGHEPPPEAMTLFESARDHYRNGRYAEAVEELERALVLDPAAPTLLFNLGRVYELMGEYDRSIATFERLLAVIGPDAEERAQTETTLARLRGAREHAAPPPSAAEVGTMEEGPTFVRERGVADDGFWGVLVGGGVAALGAGALGITALVLRGIVDNWVLGLDGTLEDRDLMLVNAQGLGIAADVTGGVAVAALAAAVGLYVFRERTYEIWPEGSRAFLVPSLGPDHAGLVGGGTL
jgi:tetratricopeptide (TPR) repeat protein